MLNTAKWKLSKQRHQIPIINFQHVLAFPSTKNNYINFEKPVDFKSVSHLPFTVF